MPRNVQQAVHYLNGWLDYAAKPDLVRHRFLQRITEAAATVVRISVSQ
jgi:hypothetical protein